MLDSSKVNESTGEKVREALIAVGVETPMHQDSLTGIDKQKEIEEHFRSIMVLLGLDITDDSLKETPRRVAKMFLNEIFWGLDYRNFPKVTTIENKMQYETMLLERHIKVVSECVPGYQVINSCGANKKANAVRVGDLLWTISNGIPVKTRVSKITTHTAESIVTVKLKNGVKFDVTPDHPLMTKNGWVEAGSSLGCFVEHVNSHTFCKDNFELNIGKELGYFLAVVAAECSIQQDRRISLETENEEVADKFIKAIKVTFGKDASKEKILKPSSFTGKKFTQYRVRIVSSQIAKRTLKLLGIPFKEIGCGSKTFKFHFPKVCFGYYSVWRGFVEGYLDTDGSRYSNGKQSYERIMSANEMFMTELCTFLGRDMPKGHMSDVSTRPCYAVDIPKSKKTREWFVKHGFDQNEKSLDLGESEYVEVVSIVEHRKPTRVYSFKCAEYPTFCINGVLTHNCEHHFLPIIGEAFVAYVPNEKIIGLSKINRIVEFFCRRPQVQERLTEQIYCALSTILDTENVAVLIRADHSCVKLRGVEDSNSDTITSRLGGIFYNGALRNEFYQMIKLQ